MIGKTANSVANQMQLYDDWMGEFAEGVDEAAEHAQALAHSGMSEAVFNYVKDLDSASIRQMSFGQKVKLTTIALKEQAAAFIKSPFFKAAAIAAGIILIVKVLDALTVSLEESKEKLSNLKEEYKTNESELSSLNSELETTEDRIKELQALKDTGTISLTEQEELDNLLAQNRELERKINLLKLEQELKQSQINQAFIETVGKDFNTPHISLDNIVDFQTTHDGLGNVYTTPIFGTEQDYIKTQIKEYQDNLTKIAEIDAKYKDDLAAAIEANDIELATQIQQQATREKQAFTKSNADLEKYFAEKQGDINEYLNGVTYIAEPTTDQQRAVNTYISQMEDIRDAMAIAMGGGDTAKSDAINRLIDTTFADATAGLKELGEQGKVTADSLRAPEYDAFIQKLLELGVITDDTDESLNFVALAFNNMGDAATGSTSGVSKAAVDLNALNTSIDGVQSRISSLTDSLTNLRNGSLTLSDVIDLIQEFPELVEYVDLTAEGFGNLEQGLENLIKESPKDLIKQLQKLKETSDLTDAQANAIDGLCASLENLSTEAIKDASGEFGVLADAINGAKQAKTELDKALAVEDYDTGYEGRVQAFKDLQETLKSGEVGGRAFAAYKEYFGLMDMNAEQIAVWAKNNAKYFKDGSDGVKAFMQTVEQMNRSGALSADIASYDSSTGNFRYDINELDAFADALGWTEEMLQDFINKYRMYCEEWTSRTTELTRQEFFDQDLIMQLDDGQALASLEQLMEYTRMSKDEVIALVNEINHLNVQDAVSELQALSEGGNVDLTIRPTVDTSVLADAGWDVAAGESATVFTSTFSNEAGNIAVNFTPIIVDENGNHIGTLSENELTSYAEGVIAGTQSDYLNLQIGAVFEGEDAIAQAEAAADRIHDLHALVLEGGGLQIIGADQVLVTQQVIDNLAATKQSAEEVKEALVELSQTEGVTFEAGIEYNGQTVEEILAEATGDGSEVVSVDITMNVNDEEVNLQITTTETRLNEVCGKDWQVTLTGNSEDAEAKEAAVNALITDLTKNPYTVTIDGETSSAETGLTNVKDLIGQIPSYKKVTIEYNVTGDSIPKFASGTKSAPGGPALLGDEYSPSGSPKPELVLTDDSAYVAGLDGPEIRNLNAGDQVIPANETKRILSGNPNIRKSIIPRFAAGSDNSLAAQMLKDQAAMAARAQKKAEEAAAAQKAAAQASGASAYWSNQAATKAATPTTGNAGGSNSWGSGYTSGGSGPGSGSSSNSNSGSNSSDSSSNEKSQFEKDYEYHKHLLEMEQEDYENFLKWLEGAYQDAYNKGEIELEDFYKYQEEVFQGQKELFMDGLDDIEHRIEALGREDGNSGQIINLYNQMIVDLKKEIAAARARGLDQNDEYIQELQERLWDCEDEIADIREEATDDAMDAIDDLVEYRIKMLKQDLENERDALEDKKDALKDFYDKQKEMLQDVYDEEKTLEERNEKRKAKSDIESELAQLEFDDSAWAQKRKLELQEELAAAQKDLDDFEKEQTLESTQDLLDKMYERQEAQIQTEIDAIEAKLNDPNALYNQALHDIQNNTQALYQEMVEYNNKYGTGNPEDVKNMWDEAKASLDEFLATFGRAYKDIILVASPGGYASGTRSATPGIHRMFEDGDEFEFRSSDGNRYRVFSGGEKVLNTQATNFLYDFATSGGKMLTNIFSDLLKAFNIGNISKPSQPVQLSTGDIIIQGNANERTVSEIRRAQREGIDLILKEFTRLSK